MYFRHEHSTTVYVVMRQQKSNDSGLGAVRRRPVCIQKVNRDRFAIDLITTITISKHLQYEYKWRCLLSLRRI